MLRAWSLGPRLGEGWACGSAGRALGSHAHSTDHPRVVAQRLPTTPNRHRLLRPDHAPLGHWAGIPPQAV